MVSLLYREWRGKLSCESWTDSCPDTPTENIAAPTKKNISLEDRLARRQQNESCTVDRRRLNENALKFLHGVRQLTML